MPKLSIIVPIYKVEAYLPKCIDSVLAQSFRDWELILVDDGSPDGCPAICDRYAADDSRIRVIHQPNAGVSAARNRGLDAASAELITFIDPDDHVHRDCYKLMLDAMERTGTGMAICGFLYEYPDGSTEPRVADGAELVLSHHDLVRAQFDIPWSIRPGTCNKIFQKTVIGDLRFDTTLKCCEDTYFLSQYLLRFDGTAVHLHLPLYINLQREGSAMRGGLSLNMLEDSLRIHRIIAEETAMRYEDLTDYAFAYYLDSCAWKHNAFFKPQKLDRQEEQRLKTQASRRIRRRVMKEWPRILSSSSLSWKLKVYYFMFALGLR